MSGTIGALIPTVLVVSWPALSDAIDDARDYFRSSEDRRVDDLGEVITNRPYWAADSVELIDESLEELRSSDRRGGLLSVTSDGRPVSVDASRLTSSPYRYAGDPIVLVGRVSRVADLGPERGSVLARREFEVRSADGQDTIYAGTSAYEMDTRFPARGDLILLRGYVTASAQIESGARDRDSAYFTAVQAVELNDGRFPFAVIARNFAQRESAGKAY